MPGYFYKLFFNHHFRVVHILFISLFLSAGCGYHAGIYPEGATSSTSVQGRAKQTLAIPLFSNATLEPLLEKQITQTFKETLSRRGFHIEKNRKKALLSLAGRITAFGRTPISLSLLGAAREYRIRIKIKIRLLRTKDGKELRTYLLQGLAEYNAQADAGRDRIAKDRAIREAAQKMANEIALALSVPTEKISAEAATK